MAYETEPGKGTIWVRERKTPRHPVMGGECVCPKCETTLNAALWTVTDRDTGEVRKDKNGKPFYSMKLDEGDSKPPKKKKEEPEGDGLPF